MDAFFTPTPNGITEYTGMLLILLNVAFYGLTIAFAIHVLKHPERRGLFKVLAIIQLLEFLATHIWYFAVGYMSFPLPFFHCRITKLIFAALILTGPETKWRPAKAYAIPISIVGAIASFLVPVPDPFVFPHLTHVTFFLGHFILMLLAVGLLLLDRQAWTIRDFGIGQVILIGVNIFFTIAARVSGKNYGYFLEAPIFKKAMSTLSVPLFTLAMFAAYAVLYTVAFFLAKAIHVIFVGKQVATMRPIAKSPTATAVRDS